MKYKVIILVLVIIAVCTFILRLPFYVPFLLIIVAFPIIFFKTTIAIIGNFFYLRGDEVKCRPFLKKAVELNTISPAAHLNYAVLLMREGAENAKLALSYLQKAERLNKQLMLAKNISLALGSCYWILGETDKGIEELERMRTKYDYVNARVLATLGYLYFMKEDYEKALELSNKALEESPDSASAWDNLGQIYLKQNEIEKAKESFDKAIEIKSNMADSLYYMGVIAELENNKKLALEYYERANKSDLTGLSTVSRTMVEEKLKLLQGHE